MRPLVFLALLLLAACAGEPAESRFDKIAKAYCECTGQLAALNEKAAAMANDTNAVRNFEQNLLDIQAEYGRAKECAAGVLSRFGKLNPAELDSVRMSLAGKCANMAEQGDLLQEMLGE